MLKRFSLQKKLTFLMAVLLILLLASSLAIWISFSRINSSQDNLLRNSVPTIQFVSEVVGSGLEFINIGTSVINVDSYSDLKLVEYNAKELLIKIEKDIVLVQEVDESILGLSTLENNVEGLAYNIDNQIVLKWNLLGDISDLSRDISFFNDYANNVLIQIKAMLSTSRSISENKLSHIQDDLLKEIRFNVLQIVSMINSVRYIDSIEKLKIIDAEIASNLKNIERFFLELKEESRNRLEHSITPMRDHLRAANNVFSLAKGILSAQSVLQEIQLDSLAIAGRLDDVYAAMSKSVNVTLESRAIKTLDLISNSTVILSIVALLSVVYCYVLSVFILKPMLVDRLQRLSIQTRKIADHDFDVEIETDGSDEISALASSVDYFREQLIDKAEINERLAIQEKTLLSIVENAFEGVFAVSLDGRIVHVNPATRMIFKLKDNENILEEKIARLFPDDSVLFESHASGEFGCEEFLVCKEKAVIGIDFNDQQFIGSLSMVLTDLPEGKMYICFLRDITEEHNTRKKINTLIEQIMQSNSDLEQFAYSCSHDLQEPVRMIESFSELLENNIGDKLDDESSRYLHFILKGAKQAKALIKEMLDYSKLDQTSLTRSWVSLDQICQYVSEVTVITREESQAQFSWENSDEKLYVMPSLIQRLIINLVTNGLKYNESDRKKITVSCDSNETDWVLCVEDNGIGIDPKYSKRVFEVFKRLVNRRDYEGSGIGLSICQKIAEKHGGKIWVESEVGKGSQFYVSLPKNDYGQE